MVFMNFDSFSSLKFTLSCVGQKFEEYILFIEARGTDHLSMNINDASKVKKCR